MTNKLRPQSIQLHVLMIGLAGYDKQCYHQVVRVGSVHPPVCPLKFLTLGTCTRDTLIVLYVMCICIVIALAATYLVVTSKMKRY